MEPGYICCTTCNIQIKADEDVKAHYGSAWHYYNIKRRATAIKPISLLEFNSLPIQQESPFQGELDKTYCNVCRKVFNSENSLESHLNSKKHKTNLKMFEGDTLTKTVVEKHTGHELYDKMEQVLQCRESLREEDDDMDWESADEDDEEEVLEETEDDEKEVEDENKFETMCLFCPKVSLSFEANVSHMTKKHSFFIPYIECLKDLKGFVNDLAVKVFRGHMCLWCDDHSKVFLSIKAVRQHMRDKEHCRANLNDNHIKQFYDFSEFPELAGVERPDANKEEDSQLVLASGSTIGNRALKVYYKQKVPLIQKLISKLLGWTGSFNQQQSAVVSKHIQKAQAIKAKYEVNKQVKHNKFQPHFRLQIMM